MLTIKYILNIILNTIFNISECSKNSTLKCVFRAGSGCKSTDVPCVCADWVVVVCRHHRIAYRPLCQVLWCHQQEKMLLCHLNFRPLNLWVQNTSLATSVLLSVLFNKTNSLTVNIFTNVVKLLCVFLQTQNFRFWSEVRTAFPSVFTNLYFRTCFLSSCNHETT